MTSFEPSPNPNCLLCHSTGYEVFAAGEYAQAKTCRCVPNCERCGGYGVITLEQDGVLRSGRCRCQKLPDRTQLFNLAKIPARHGKNTIASFDHLKSGTGTQALAKAHKWMNNFSKKQEEKGFVFSGPVGTGKTHLLVGVIKNLIFEHGYRVRFVEFSRLLSSLRDGYSKGLSDSQLLDELVEVPVLAIDELGKGRVSDWELTIIDELISRRYNAMKPIIGTTNYSWKQAQGVSVPNLATMRYGDVALGDRVGERVFSRLQQMCLCTEIQGKDYREPDLQKIHGF